MRLIDSINSDINYGVTVTTSKIHQIATTPKAVKTVFQLAMKLFAAYDLYSGIDPQSRKITDAMSGSIKFIEFYGSFKNIMFWVNPFSKETLDDDALLHSIESTLCDPIKKKCYRKKNERVAQAVFQEVMEAKEYHSKGEVFDAIKHSLENKGYDATAAQAIAEKIIVQQKARPITLIFVTACATITDLAGNIETLKKWGIIEFAFEAAEVGSKSKIFMYVYEFGAERILGVISISALLVLFTGTSYKVVTVTIQLYQSTRSQNTANQKSQEELDKIYKELRDNLLDLASVGTTLLSVGAPLLFTLNPPAVVALAILAKGTGLICILIK